MLSHSLWASLVTQLVKNPPAVEETPVQFLGREVPLEETGYKLQYSWTSLVAQMVKNLPAIRETRVQSLCWEDPLEEGMVTPPQCSCLENPHRHRRLAGRLQFVGSQRVGHDWAAQHSTAHTRYNHFFSWNGRHWRPAQFLYFIFLYFTSSWRRGNLQLLVICYYEAKLVYIFIVKGFSQCLLWVLF